MEAPIEIMVPAAYGVSDGSAAPAEFVRSHEFDLPDVRTLEIYSDDYLAIPPVTLESYEELHLTVRQQDPHKCLGYPPTKPRRQGDYDRQPYGYDAPVLSSFSGRHGSRYLQAQAAFVTLPPTMLRGLLTSALVPILSLSAAAPSGTTYTLQSYGIGSGGVANASSTTYSMNGITGELSGTQLDGTTYSAQPGLMPTSQANVPPAPTFTNPDNYYNKLHLVINIGGNPSDSKFAIAISADNFATTQYVQNDDTVGSALGSEDYQTYALWGGSTGVDVVGLLPNTTYKVKATAMQGAFSQSAYGPTAAAATVNPSLTFDIDISSTDTDTNPPYALSFSSLLPGSVSDSPQKIWLDFDTNAGSGGNVYLYGKNAGLRSPKTGYTLGSVTGDLGALAQGFGAQSSSATQSGGGPFTATSPYNGSSQNVGVIDTSIRKAYGATAPVVAGRSAILLKAKVSSATPSASDYSETLTVLASTGY